MFLRIFTGIIGIGIAAVVIQFGGAPFAFVAMLLSLAAWYEYSAAFERTGIYTARILGGLILIVLLFCAWLGNIEEILFDVWNFSIFFTDSFGWIKSY